MLVVLISALTLRLGAQPLSGTVTINASAPTSATNYTSFTQLSSTLSAVGISGPLTVDVVASTGPYVEQVTFGSISGASSANRITINGNQNILSFSATSSAGATILMSGADYFTVNDLNIQANGATWAYGILFTGNADYNVFNNCTITCPLNGTSSSQIPVVFSGSSSSYSTMGPSGSYNAIRSCTLANGYFGVTMYGNSSGYNNTTSNCPKGNEISSCTISDWYIYGIYLNYYTETTTVKNNVISRPTRTSSSTCYGIYAYGTAGSIIDGNWFKNFYFNQQTFTGTCYGVYVYYNLESTYTGYYYPSRKPNMVRNNVISNLEHNGTLYGIYHYYGDGEVYNNTLVFDNTASTSGSTTYGIYTYAFTTSYPCTMKNNIIYITRGGAGTKYGMYNGSGSTGNDMLIDRNCVYMASSGGAQYVLVSSSTYSTQANASSGGFNVNGWGVDPQFVSPSTGDFHPTNATINNGASNMGLTFDQLLAVRNPTAPDPGALEFLTPLCAGSPTASSILGGNIVYCPGQSAGLSLSSLTSVYGQGLTYSWQASNISAVGPWTPVTAPAATPFNLTTLPLNSTMYYGFVLTCTNPGGGSSTATTTLNIAGTTTSVVPYLEDFEQVGITNRLPNCSWYSPNIGGPAYTYTAAGSNYRLPYSGSSFASFQSNSPNTNMYFYTNGIQLNAGITYSANLWYITDLNGNANWQDLSILVGNAQTPAAQNLIVSSGNAAVAPQYKKLGGTFTVPTSGLYYVAVRANAGSATGAAYLSWDDLSITVPCQIAANQPSITVSANNATICAGTQANLSAAGATTYTWSTGASGSALIVAPTSNTVYTVMGTSSVSGCSGSATQNITVKSSPNVGVNPVNPICAGNPVNLVATSAVNYIWNTGGTNAVLTVTPSSNTSYTVVGAGSNGCSASAVVQVIVNPLPSVQAAVLPAQICVGETATLQPATTAAGLSYTWISPTMYVPAPTAIVVGNPSLLGTMTYTVNATNSNGCTASSNIALTVAACTGLANVNSNEGLNVYPNPNNGSFTIELVNGQNKNIQVMDVTGRIVSTTVTSDDKAEINISNLANGVYYVKIQSNNKSDVVKVVKQ